MSEYTDPQGIWNHWIKNRDEFIERRTKLADAGHLDKCEPIDTNLTALYKATIKDLKLAALFKLLEIQ